MLLKCQKLFLTNKNSLMYNILYCSVVKDLVQGLGRLTTWSRGLVVVYTTWFCTGQQLPGSEACVDEPVWRENPL